MISNENLVPVEMKETTEQIVTTQLTNNSSKIFVLDTSFFINQKPLNLAEGSKYFTTEFIIKEIKDEKAREYLNLNREFIDVRNPSRDIMKIGKKLFLINHLQIPYK